MDKTSISNRQLLQRQFLIPDQVIEASQMYYYVLDAQTLFDEQATLIGVTETGSTQLPAWLSLQFVGSHYDTPGTVYEVNVQGDTAYIADGPGGFRMLDMRYPDSPLLLGQYAIDDARDVVVNDTIAYVADYTQGLYLLDISNPAQISLLGEYSQRYVNGLVLAGHTVWLAAANGVYGVDVSNPYQPVAQGSYMGLDSASAITIEDNVAYVAADFEGVYLLDIRQPNSPNLLGRYPSVDQSQYVVVEGNTAYVADGGDLQMLDVTDVTNPQQLGSIPIVGGGAVRVTVQDNRAYVAADTTGLQVIDVRQPSDPQRLSIIAGSGSAHDIALYQDRVLMADGAAGVQCIDLTKGILQGIPTISRYAEQVSLTVTAYDANDVIGSQFFQLTIDSLPQRVDNRLSNQNLWPNQAATLQLDNNALFIDPNNGFLPLSIAWIRGSVQPVPDWLELDLKPALLDGIYNTGPTTSIEVQEDVAYLTEGGLGLHRVDVSNPLNPQLISSVSTQGYVTHTAIDNDVAYITDNIDGLVIEDIRSTPTTRLSTYPLTQPRCVVVDSNVAYVADGPAGLQLVDITDASMPSHLAEVALGYTRWVDVQGTYAYLANDVDGLLIVDVSNATFPQPRGTYGSNLSINVVRVVSEVAYLSAVSANIVALIDVFDVNTPVLLSEYMAQGEVQHIHVQSNTLFLSLGDAGIEVVDVSDHQYPIQRAHYTESLGTVVGMSVQGNTAYLADSSGLKVLDVSHWELVANPTSTDVGNYNIRLTATNHLGGQASELMTMRVEGAPTFQAVIPTQYAKVGLSYSYTVPLGLVTDPNFDPIYYHIEALSDGGLPTWLSFSTMTGSFIGTPPETGTGEVRLQLTATDNIAGSSAMEFDLSVDHMPIVRYLISQQVVGFGQDYRYTLRPGTFEDIDSQDSLRYHVQLSNAQPLPDWLHFDNQTLTFSGTPTQADEALFNVVVIASDTRGGVVSTSVGFLVEPNSAPVVRTSIVAQSVEVSELFNLAVPPDMFYDRNGDVLTINANEVRHNSLPDWLSFDTKQLLFTGTPGHSDTNTYADRVHYIELTASDGKAKTSSVFTINVRGASTLQVVWPFALSALSVLTAAYGWYKKRGLLLNLCGCSCCCHRCNRKQRYTKEQQTATIGSHYSHTVLPPTDKVVCVKIKTKKEKSDYCFKNLYRASMFGSSYKPLSGGANLPPWLEYDPASKKLATPPGRTIPQGAEGDYRVKVKGDAEVLLEQFELRVNAMPVPPPPPPPPPFEQVEADLQLANLGVQP